MVVRCVTDKIAFLLRRKYNIKTVFRPHTQVKYWLRSPKDKEPLSGPGVYSIPCECGKNYIGETQRHVSTRITEHIRSVKNCNTVTSAVAEHALDTDTNHYIRFDKTAILAREKFYVPREVREAIEISCRPNFNRDGGWSISPSWKPVLKTVLPVSVDKIKSDDIVSVVCSGLFDDSTTLLQLNRIHHKSHQLRLLQRPLPSQRARSEPRRGPVDNRNWRSRVCDCRPPGRRLS
ncbi:hypothetical protein NE865_11653 [Phthorimaea operculella]|nr:hypothetical protein NE865_11653 [Phthorimaea operculella]